MSSFNHSARAESHRSTWRRFLRYRYLKEVSIGIMRGDAPSYITGFCLNVSEGGMAVRGCEQLNMGEIVDLRIELPVGLLCVPACVRHHSGTDYGLEFIALGIAERDYIRDGCHALGERSERPGQFSPGSSDTAPQK